MSFTTIDAVHDQLSPTPRSAVGETAIVAVLAEMSENGKSWVVEVPSAPVTTRRRMTASSPVRCPFQFQVAETSWGGSPS